MKFNLSDWALHHKSFIWFLMLVSMIAGIFAYISMGREEDPSFTIRTMVVSASLPGATAQQTATQVTDRIERKLQELDVLDYTRSESYPGRSVVYVELRSDTPNDQIAPTWTRVRQMMSDIRADFPNEFQGFGFNDDFGDVYGNIYAFTAPDFQPQTLKSYVEDMRDAVLRLDQAGKVDLIGTRERVVFAEFSAQRLAALGLDGQTVINTLSAQNAIVPSGVIQTGQEQVVIRVTGQFDSATALAKAPLRSGDIFYTLSDVAQVSQGYADPPSALFRFDGMPAIGLIVGMREGGNILNFGADLDALMATMAAQLPLGITMHKVADQPRVVEDSVTHFLRALAEAVAIVLAVSFISLGMRAGFVVSLTIPLVLALTFVVLDMIGITLQRISLGALIIALGLLVDDAMIAIETMITRLEVGDSLARAASHAWTSIAWPMLTGTLVTVAGFIPIGLNASQAGEYTRSLFYVITISLLLSWVVAVLFAPVLGATFLPPKWSRHTAEPGRMRRGFHRVLRWSMVHRWLTITLTIAIFAVSLVGLNHVEQQFFPNSDRTQIMVDVTLRQNANIEATDAEVQAFDAWLANRDGVAFWASYIGTPSPRFVLTLNLPTATPNVGQVMIETDSLAARDRLIAQITQYSNSRPGVEFFAKSIELGPPVGKPVQYRLSGPDAASLPDYARNLAQVLAQDSRLGAIDLDWNEPVRVVRVVLDQARLRQLGLTQSDVAQVLTTLYQGQTITQLRDDTDLIDVTLRGQSAERRSIEALQNLQFANTSGVPIPLSSIARLEYTTEPPIIRARDRVPTLTVRAAVLTADQPATIVAALSDRIAAFGQTLPQGYTIALGGAVEESSKSQAPIIAVVPFMLLILLTLVMMQMQSFRLLFVVLAVAPLGLIGVVAAMLPFGAPLGFVAILGVLALLGILIRNSIILIQAAEDLRAIGHSRWQAIFEASDQRARPILLTAGSASLALIPIARQVFWGPMAYAMMGGIMAGTLITLLFAPALYCAVFRIRPEAQQDRP
ncbi:ACR family transporter [Thioclava sp. SK-1]|uniref:efflux RND transporter permease subunit n=1 Tax=Thioclava sp. SK-1 TaxID=1889770 RepID=UPI0008247678|nr:efflux RND transporter permease subunit [Thioclava sp. SK-1]OCX66599.1 ACR family transporter [Thioclava sp. SK-1]